MIRRFASQEDRRQDNRQDSRQDGRPDARRQGRQIERLAEKPSNTVTRATIGEQIVPEIIKIEPEKKVEVIAIGGLGEIGKNTWAFRCDDQILVVDAGLGFPNESMPGIDLVLPDLTYLIENKDKIAGLVITHGHEDHIGGIPNLLRSVDVPIIYGPPLAIGLVESKLKEHGLLQKSSIKRIKPRETFKIGSFAVTFVRNNHSIPDSFSLIIQSPAGLIVHSGDFKFDHTPVDGELFDFAALSEASKKGVQLLISDSTNSERPGFSPSEKYVYPNIEEAFIRATKRIIITTFASQVHRIRQILEISQKHGKKVAILGRSMLNIALIARQLGYMTFPDGLLIRAEEVSHYPLNKIVVLTTGSQGEPMSALTRISKGTHRQISIIPGDTVIVSATPIPGNERAVASTINALFSRGAQVVYGKEAGVHVSGHASVEEQKIMLNLIKPKFFMPAHGEHRMLVSHGELAQEVLGMPSEDVFVMENGDVLEISTDKNTETSAKISGKVPVGIVMVDSSDHSHGIAQKIVEDRKELSTKGFVSAVITFDSQSKKIFDKPDVVLKGVISNNPEDLSTMRESVANSLLENWQKCVTSNDGENKLKSALTKIVAEACKKHNQKPLVQVMLLDTAASS